MKTCLILAMGLLSLSVAAQTADKKSVVIGSMTAKPNALLIVNPQNADQGVLLPQLSTGQRISLRPTSPAEDGLVVFDTNLKSYYYWSDGAWVRLNANNRKENSFYNIDPVGFRALKPDGNVSQNNVAVFETDNTFVTAVRDGQGETIMAPVDLPHGAVIKELTVYYFDNDPDNIVVQFIRKSFSGNNQLIINWASSDSLASPREQLFNNFNGMESVDLENYTYRLLVTFDIDAEDVIDQPSQALQRIYGIRIKYQK